MISKRAVFKIAVTILAAVHLIPYKASTAWVPRPHVTNLALVEFSWCTRTMPALAMKAMFPHGFVVPRPAPTAQPHDK